MDKYTFTGKQIQLSQTDLVQMEHYIIDLMEYYDKATKEGVITDKNTEIICPYTDKIMFTFENGKHIEVPDNIRDMIVKNWTKVKKNFEKSKALKKKPVKEHLNLEENNTGSNMWIIFLVMAIIIGFILYKNSH